MNSVDQDWRGKDVAMVFQEPMSALNPVMTVGKQLQECFQNKDAATRRQLSKQWFAKVQLPNPETIGKRYPHQLSGGQKQRVMIAMAMCNHPQLLIADEPTTALDASVQAEILALMKSLQRELNSAMIFITHDLAVARSMADKVMVMKDGKVVEYAYCEKVFNHPEALYTQALLKTKPSAQLRGFRLPVVEDFLKDPKAESALVRMTETAIQRDTAPLLVVQNMSVRFPAKKDWKGSVTEWYHAVSDVSFDMMHGESLGLVGESGSGKSTIGKALVGLVSMYKGVVTYQGQSLFPVARSKSMGDEWPIQMVFQDAFAALNPRRSIGDMIAEPIVVHQKISKDALNKQVLSLLDHIGIERTAVKKYPHEFSGGQRQRLGIARALAVNPKILICDESVSALDVSVQAQVLNLLNDLKQELNLSYLFISHDLNVVRYFCNRLLFLSQGKITEKGINEELFQQP